MVLWQPMTKYAILLYKTKKNPNEMLPSLGQMGDKMTIKELSEHEIQVYLCKYLDKKNIKYWATPNGFIYKGDKLQTARYIKYLHSEGVRRGTFDLTLLFGNGNVAFLELKTPKGRPSKEQLEWLEYFIKNNYNARICKGLKEAMDFVEELEKKFTS